MHGLSKTRQYKILKGMKQRCHNKNDPHFKNYGARGITVCDEWLGPDGARAFYEWSISHGYRDDLTIDRVDGNKGYSPSNCIWLRSDLNSPHDNLVAKLIYVIFHVPTFEREYLLALIESIESDRDREYLIKKLKERDSL